MSLNNYRTFLKFESSSISIINLSFIKPNILAFRPIYSATLHLSLIVIYISEFSLKYPSLFS